jgi:hypothetical protein
VPYPAAAKLFLKVPTPAVSVDTTPVFDTRLVIVPASPYPNIALAEGGGGGAVIVNAPLNVMPPLNSIIYLPLTYLSKKGS